MLARFSFILVQLIISLALFVFILMQIDVRQFFTSLLQIKIGYLLIGLILFPLGHVACAVKWKYLAKPLGIHKGLKPLIGLYFIGVFFNFLLPTSIGGDITRSLYLNPGASRTRSVLSVLVERGTGVISLLILASIVMLTDFGRPIPFWLRYAFPAAVFIGLVVFASLPKLLPDTPTRLGDIVKKDLNVFWRRPQIGIIAVLYSMMLHSVLVVIHVCVARALSLSIPVPYHFVTLSIGSLAGLLPSFNGIGVRDAAYIYLLALIGVSPAHGLLFSFCWFAIMAVSGFIGCIVYLMRGLDSAQEVSHG